MSTMKSLDEVYYLDKAFGYYLCPEYDVKLFSL